MSQFPFDHLAPFPAVGIRRPGGLLDRVANRVHASLPDIYSTVPGQGNGALSSEVEEDEWEGDGEPAEVEFESLDGPRRLVRVDGIGGVRRINRSSSARQQSQTSQGGQGGSRSSRKPLANMGRSPDADGYVTRELAPGIQIRCRKGVKLAAVNVGSRDVPVFLITPGAASAAVGNIGSDAPYVGAVPLLLMLAQPVARTVATAVDRQQNEGISVLEQAAEVGQDAGDFLRGALGGGGRGGDAADPAEGGPPTAADRASPGALLDTVAALMTDSDGHRTRT